MEILGRIGIDPKIIVAQIVNFLALAFILWKLLYKPFLEMLSRRKSAIGKIEEDLASVGKKKNEAEVVYRAKILDGESRANEIISQAHKTAELFENTAVSKNQEYLDQVLRELRARIEGAKGDLVKFNQDIIRD